jgi:excisionase family DNA binding protein
MPPRKPHPIFRQSPRPDWRSIANSLLLTPEEAAEALRIGRSKVYELMRSGELASITIGRARRIPSKALDEFINARLEEAA